MLELTADIGPILNDLLAGLADPGPVLRDFQAHRRSEFEAQFERGTDPEGEAIAPLSAAYEIWKRQNAPGKPIRELTGQTRGSYRSRVVGDQLIEEVSSPQAIAMQRGTPKMPARPYLPERLTPADAEALKQIVFDRLVN